MQHRRILWGLARAALVVVLAAGTIYLAAPPDGYAADTSDPPKPTTGALDVVPADAAAVVSIHVADLWNYPPANAVLQKQAKDLPPFRQFRETLGLGLEEIERLTVILQGEDWLNEWFSVLALTTLKPYDQKAILAAVAPNAKEKKVGDRSYYDNPHGPSVFFLNDRTCLLASSGKMEAYLKHSPPTKEGPLAAVIGMASDKHILVAGINIAALATATAKEGATPAWAKALLKAQLATLTVDLDDQVKADFRVMYTSEADAKDGAAGLNDGLDLLRGGIGDAMKMLTKEQEVPTLIAMLKDVQAALRDVKADANGLTVEAAGSLKLDLDATALAERIEKAQKEASALGEKVVIEAKRDVAHADLILLGHAARDYAEANGKMLPAAVYDKSGKPLLSWRVALLPYIMEGDLYKQFHLDEPWDSENNKKLLDKMPTQFAPLDNEVSKKHETFFQGFVGKGSVFEEGAVLRYPASITDGPSNTILFVEAAKSVPWTKPEDIPFDDGKILAKVGGLKLGGAKAGFLAAMCDGHVRFLPLTLKEETLRALITRNGGEVIPDLDK
jgi:Protein of unknown function (DUF1559)